MSFLTQFLEEFSLSSLELLEEELLKTKSNDKRAKKRSKRHNLDDVGTERRRTISEGMMG